MRLRRVLWKREPTEDEIFDVKLLTAFGPSVFMRGNEWLFIKGPDELSHAPTPPSYTLLNR